MDSKTNLSVKECRKRFYVYAGAVKISLSFRTEELAQMDLSVNGALYKYWASSFSTSILNDYANGNVRTIECD